MTILANFAADIIVFRHDILVLFDLNKINYSAKKLNRAKILMFYATGYLS